MAQKERIERPATVIKAVIKPLSNDLKGKISSAFGSFVTAIKVKHLG